MKKTVIIMAAALVLVAALAVGATLAWLIDDTDPVVNTFTIGDINITLTESENLDLKMIPGKEIAKDPKVTVEAGSEACWLFVKVEESDNFDDFMTYAIATGWTALSGEDGVYYREVAATTADTDFYVLADVVPSTTDVGANGSVMVKTSVMKTMMNELTENTYPTLTFTAYAVQKDGFAYPSDAWAVALSSSST